MTQEELLKKKLSVFEDTVLCAVIFDILHLKSEKFKDMNVGQHDDYKEIVSELRTRYEQQLEKLK